jgi:bacterioferritin-associated ferredoxin
MFVCHCRAVTDGAVRASIEAGACTLTDLAERCGAGSRCGGCRQVLQQLLAAVGAVPSVPAVPSLPSAASVAACGSCAA